ncbi:uncharacterized protein LOC141852698 [Brevipalpus obovatus]|uniref:uncharacterized protein LOC141852698 n=1 Tax=Brevipalpus obovatus TaxID=246614 RepID=UPI003D9DBB5F
MCDFHPIENKKFTNLLITNMDTNKPEEMEKKVIQDQEKILEESEDTIKLYTILSSLSLIIYLLVMWFYFHEQFTFCYMAITFPSLILFAWAILTLNLMATVPQLGINFNRFAKSFRNCIILTWVGQCISLILNCKMIFLSLWATYLFISFFDAFKEYSIFGSLIPR